MPGGGTVAGARLRRPARRGCRGGWRARRAREAGSSDQLTAPDTGANGPRRVECHQPPNKDYRRGDSGPAECRRASCLSSAPPQLDSHNRQTDRPARSDTSLTFAYDRPHLLAVRNQMDEDASRGVAEVIRLNLPAHLTSQICRRGRRAPASLRRNGAVPGRTPAADPDRPQGVVGPGPSHHRSDPAGRRPDLHRRLSGRTWPQRCSVLPATTALQGLRLPAR